MRLLLDTNALIDFYSARKPHCDWVNKLFIAQAFGDVELWTSAKSFIDVFYVLKQPIGSDRLQGMINKSLNHLHVCAIDGEDVRDSCRLRWGDFEDCLIDRAAQKIKADVIITRDKSGFAKSSLRTLSAEEFLKEKETSEGISYDCIDC